MERMMTMKCERCGADGAQRIKRVPFPGGVGHVTLLVPQNLCQDCVREIGKSYQISYSRARIRLVKG